MEASTLFINGVIQKNTLLRIPYFQRRYVWKEDNWNRFAIDMESTLDSERNYFLGALILKEDTVTKADKMLGIGKKQLVIDGQQRLTTIFLTLYAIKELMLERSMNTEAERLENMYLVNPFNETNKFKLKPLVSDDAVYQLTKS